MKGKKKKSKKQISKPGQLPSFALAQCRTRHSTTARCLCLHLWLWASTADGDAGVRYKQKNILLSLRNT